MSGLDSLDRRALLLGSAGAGLIGLGGCATTGLAARREPAELAARLT